jgi:hypothetical protein
MAEGDGASPLLENAFHQALHLGGVTLRGTTPFEIYDAGRLRRHSPKALANAVTPRRTICFMT